VDILLCLRSDLHAKIFIRCACFDLAGNLLRVAGISIFPGSEENTKLDSSDSLRTACQLTLNRAITLICLP
jgi:hypothetical protein